MSSDAFKYSPLPSPAISTFRGVDQQRPFSSPEQKVEKLGIPAQQSYPAGIDRELHEALISELNMASESLKGLSARVSSLQNQNKTLMMMVSVNDAQLASLMQDADAATTVVANLHNIIYKMITSANAGIAINSVPSSEAASVVPPIVDSLPVPTSALASTGALSVAPSNNNVSLVRASSLPSNTRPGGNGDNIANRAPIPFPRPVSPTPAAIVRPSPSPLLSSPQPRSLESREIAAVLAASAAAQVMGEQRGLQDIDRAFYAKVLTKLLSPQPHSQHSNWNTEPVPDLAFNVEICNGTISDAQILSKITPGLASDMATSANAAANTQRDGKMEPNKEKHLVATSTTAASMSPVGPGATLTFKSTNNDSSLYQTSDTYTTKALNKMHALLDKVIKPEVDSVSPLTVYCTGSTPKAEPVQIPDIGEDSKEKTAREKPRVDSTPKHATPKSIKVNLDAVNKTPSKGSPYQSPRLLSDELPGLANKAEGNSVSFTGPEGNQASRSGSIEAPAVLVKPPMATDVPAKLPKKKSTIKSTPKARSSSKPKVRSQPASQPASRSSSRRNSMTRTASPSPAPTSAPKMRSPAKATPRPATTKPRPKSIAVAAKYNPKQNMSSPRAHFNEGSDIHIGSTTMSSINSMSLSTIGTKPGSRPFSRSSSQPLNYSSARGRPDRGRVNMLLEKYSSPAVITEEPGSGPGAGTSRRPIESHPTFTNVVTFINFFLDPNNCDPLSSLPTGDVLTEYAEALSQKMRHVTLDQLGKTLMRVAEWIMEQLNSEHFFNYVTATSFVSDFFSQMPRSLAEVSMEIAAYNKRRRDEYERRSADCELERKKGSPRLKYMEKPEEPKKHSMDQFYTAFKRCLRSLWCPELERELIYYLHSKFMDMTATEGIILPELRAFEGDVSKSIFPGHNLYNYRDFFNKQSINTSSSATTTTATEYDSMEAQSSKTVAYDLYFYYCLLSIYLLLNDCFPIRFNIYYMNYKTFQGIFRYIKPEDLEQTMSMSSSFRIYWPAWKDVRRGTLRLYCKFVEIKREGNHARNVSGMGGSFTRRI